MDLPRSKRTQQLPSNGLVKSSPFWPGEDFVKETRKPVGSMFAEAKEPSGGLRPLGLSFLAAASPYSGGNVLVLQDHLKNSVL